MLNSKEKTLAKILGVSFAFIVIVLLSFLILSGAVWLVCWAFGFEFMWKYVFGVWAVSFIIRMMLPSKK